MTDEILIKLYNNERYLEYLRRNPKWYYYLDLDPKNYSLFEKEVKESLNLTLNDKIEAFKKQLNFASSIMRYFKNK